MKRSHPMHDDKLLDLLERRVREVERLAADCILQGGVHRVQHDIAQYRKKAKVPRDKKRLWSGARRSTSLAWPPS